MRYKTKIKNLTIIMSAAVFALSSVILLQPSQNASAYPANCTSDACKRAYDAKTEAEKNMADSTTRAISLENEVAEIEKEIKNLNNRIANNKDRAKKLQIKIDENQAKLNIQQAALAKLLVNMHFEEDSDAIILLAGSSSLGELAEKQARAENAQSQISAQSVKVRELKEQLETDKAAVDKALAEAEADRNAAAAQQALRNEKIAKYRDDAEAYRKDAEEQQKLISAEIAKYNSTGSAGSGVNTYPYAAQCPGINLAFLYSGGYVCQCTSYAGWKAHEYWGVSISSWGNAYSWGSSARARGYRVDNIPAAKTVAVSTLGAYGHVMWVESVNANGTINVTEYNNSWATYLVSGISQIADFGARSNVPASQYQYIHFD